MASVDPTASGVPYPVVTVNSRGPDSLELFVGEVTFTVRKSSKESWVSGIGSTNEDGVRFHEKSLGDGKDVRVWQIRRVADDRYTAETIAGH